MKKIICIFIISLGLIETSLGQEVRLPEKITISDKYSSPWGKGTNLFYEYVLELNGVNYDVTRTALQENDKKNYDNESIGKIDKKLIKKILTEINRSPTNEINPMDFAKMFPLDSIENYFDKHGDNYSIINDYQKQFIIEQLTQPEKLKNNLEQFFQSYDLSGSFDGPSTKVEIKFLFRDSTLLIKSKSILIYGLPLEINGKLNFSPRLATLLSKLIPQSETERPEQFKGSNFFSQVTRETIANNWSTIDSLESKTYQVYLDSLGEKFNVSNPTIDGGFSINWDGEQRLFCILNNSSMFKNLSIQYSTPIENGKIKYPVSNIINSSAQLVNLMYKVNFLKKYLKSNPNRKASIIYNGNGCYTDKAKENVLGYCQNLKIKIDFKKSLFIEIKDEYGNYSRWLVLPNGKYFIWWSDGKIPKVGHDHNYIKCK